MPSLTPSPRRLLFWIFLVGLITAGLWYQTRPSAPSEEPSLTTLAGIDHPQAQEQAPLESTTSFKEDLWAGRPFTLVEHGQAAKFRLALDEIYDATAPVHQQVRQIPPQKDASQLIGFAQEEAQRTGKWPGLVLYPDKGPADAFTRRVLTEQIIVKSADVTEATKKLTASGLKITQRPSYAPQHLVAEAADPLAALDALSSLSAETSVVLGAEPLLMRQAMRKALPTDPFFRDQWHLQNTGQTGKNGRDIGIQSLWNGGLEGTGQGLGIRIAVVDDGLQMNHPDLLANVDSALLHYDWNGKDGDPSPDFLHDYHGTAVAGLIAAQADNGIGISGVAPRASLVGFRLIAGMVTDATEAEAVLRGNDSIHIKNNSWGAPDNRPSVLGSTGDLIAAAMANAAGTGRGGLGTISVWSAGNGRQAGDQGNKDGYANSVYGIAVGAVTSQGALTSYSETGSHLCVVAPSGESKFRLVTTDLTGVAGYNSGSIKDLHEVDYTNAFTGTSAAAPLVSGVIALMLEVNPELNWRDVKEILLRSSTKLDPKNKGWIEHPNRDEWEAPFPPIKHHQSLGGGMINAADAVRLARIWPGLREMISESRSAAPPSTTPPAPPPPLAANHSVQVESKGTTIILPGPKEKPPAKKTKTTRVAVDFTGSTALRVEHVAVIVNAKHSRRGDLTLKLISPSGNVSTLATFTRKDLGEDYTGWTFSSLRHWGESSHGIWTLEASEPEDDKDGTLGAITVTLSGTSYPKANLVQLPITQMVAEGDNTQFSTAITTFGRTTQQWLRNGKLIPGATSSILVLNSTEIADAGTYRYTANNLTGHVEVNADLAVVRLQIPSLHVLPQTTAKFKVAAAGPGLRYQWYVGSEALRDDGRITGSRSPTLVIRQVTSLDTEGYYCRVSMGDLFINTQRASLSIMQRPDLESFVPPGPGIVSGEVFHSIQAQNGASSYRVTGLPPGVKLDSRNGTFVGKPTKPGRYFVTIVAKNAAGSSSPVEFHWTVEGLPEGTAGTYQGLVDRSKARNENLGGLFSVTITKTGALSGSVLNGKKRVSLKGRLNTYPGETYSTAEIELPAINRNDPLWFSFTLDSGLLDGSIGNEDGEEYAPLSAQRQWTTLPSSLVALKGVYNVPLIPQSPLSSHPRGSGFVAVTLSGKGRITYAGRLADGTRMIGGGMAAGEGSLPLHHRLYEQTGSVHGQLALATTPASFTASLDWWKAATTTTTRNYANGFSRLEIEGTGGAYTRPVTGLILNLPLLPDNAQLSFSHGGLYMPFTQVFTMGPRHAASFSAITNLRQIQLKVHAATGLITGKGKAMDIDPQNPGVNRQRPGTMEALVIPGLKRAEGYFLLPEDTHRQARVLSGKVVMERTSASD